ncbi:ROK family protein [Streptomyces sp. N2-109]|uniref:ROK family protein n=1 Tax=Streptomyces gossypii TaxID=2883101 RepID=A0ABT2JUC0_9ACTN|nr:ROK family transcriptional regulator [Streptomyces gossypii]MCT2591480.1 ROK family protein [Streptomyces gossypii]
MRRRNLSRALYAVAGEGPASRASVAAHIGLTRAAVSTLVDELLRAGLLVELGPGRPGGVGRPGSHLALTDRGPCGIGAEIGVDRLTVCAVDLRGVVRTRTTVPAANRASDPAAVLARLGELVAGSVRDADREGLRPAGLALAVPGLVKRDSTTVVRAPNLGWQDTEIAALLPLPHGLPLTVDNEANFGALAELWLGDASAPRDFIHVSAQVGIGGAIVLDGDLLRGARGFAGELGHVPVRPGGRRCPCGGRGCLEQYAGEEAVLRAAGLPHGDPGGRTGTLADRAVAGDAAIGRALRGAGTALGVALAGAVNLLDLRAVVMGGSLARLAPWLLPSLESELAARTAAPDAVPELLIAQAGDDGPLLGAAHAAVRAVFDDPLRHGAALTA